MPSTRALSDNEIFRFIDCPVSLIEFSEETAKKSGKKYLAIKLRGTQEFGIVSPPATTLFPRLDSASEK